MLRYKKHKRLVDGQGSGVGVMDDADREVSSFTDRAFRSLCVAEEEPYNDVPRLPSPIRGMPLSTKYHLGIFNLSVRKTQPLAQLPTLPGHRGKWAPTFQPLLNRTRNGVIDGRTNFNKLSAPEPRGYRQRSKVSSLIKTFDNIENELPDDAPLQFITPIPKISQKGNLNSEEIVSSDTALQIDSQSEITDEGKKACLVLNENHNLRRRTAREVFLESQADKCSILSGSPCSLGSPLLDTPKQTMKQKEHLRRTSFLHSENSAFKSWSDFKKRITGGEESDSSIPGTPPIFGSVTPSSPLLPRMLSGIRAREAGLEHGFSSPASTVSSSYDAVQILRTVPPLPNKKLGKQNKESSHRTGAPRIPLEARIQEEEMQIDMTSSSSFKEHSKWTRDDSISKLPLEFKQEPLQSSCSPTKINEVHAMSMTQKQARKPGEAEQEHEVSGAEEHRHASGRIKSIIQQIEKEAIGDLGSPRLSQRHGLMELPRDDTTDTLSDTSCAIPPSSNAPLQSTKNVPPQGTSHVPQSSGQVLLQDSNHIWSEVENLVSLQGFSHMPLKDTINIPLQGTSHIPPEGNNHDPFHEQNQAEPQGTRHIDPQGSSQVNHQGINHVEPQGSSPAPLQDIRHTPTQGTSQAVTQGTSHVTLQDTIHATPKDTIHDTTKDTIHPTPQGTIHPTPQGTIHPTPQGTIHPTPQGTIHPTPQGTIHPTPQGTIHPTPQGTIHPTLQGTIHPTLQGTSYITPQDITPQDISQVLLQSSTHIPPWRRTKVTPRLEADERLYSTNNHKEKALVDNITTNNENEKPSISSFNITNLLTPVIRRKNIKEALEEMPMMITPPPAEAITLKEQEVSLYRNRDDYKSKATSLLFNLKDMRKRVKSTYNPASTIKNVIEKSQVGDGRTHENVNPSISGMEKNKLVTETENVPHITTVQNVRQVERETKLDFLGNAADNYLSLSSPQQVRETSREENEETIQDGIQKDRHIPEINKEFNKLNQPEEKIRKVAENPSLKIYNKEDIAQELTESDHSDTVQQEKEHFTLEENSRLKELNENDSLEQAGDIPTIKMNYMLENNKETSPAVLPKTEDYAIDLEQVSNSREIDKTRSSDFVEEEKTEKCIDNTKDELQYYAVSSINMEESRGTGGSDNEKDKVEEKVVVVSDKQIEETICIEELQRPTSITQFKPNLFHIKDNKIKPCPVTKSVRLALLRSRSEDSLVCRKEEVISHFEDRGELELERFTPMEKEDINIGIIRTDNVKNDICPKGKVCELSTRPASETPKRNNREFNHIKMQEEETENFELLKKLCSLDAEWRRTDKVKTEKTKAENCCNGSSSSRPEGPFFHPVETCVSEITGLSPECNTLLAQNVCDSGKDLVNGDLGNSPLLTAESPHYSPLENSFLQFEDAVAFSEEIACSTINSPMSGSVTCSIVTSPMSVNTQSSGFTTALSALEDLPSPSSAGTNCRNGKFNFPTPDKPVITLIGNLEAQSTDCIKQPKENVPDTQKTHTGKPPAVPPKTEKALRRAKRLTKKRRKTEGPQRMQEGEEHESEFVLDVPSPGIITPASIIPSTQSKVTPYINNNLQADGFRSASSTPSFPVTQRKLLQDPDSGQYFVVDIPIHYKIKTFFDPETGKYLQVSLPPSERETPTLDTLNSQFMMYPGLPTLSVSSIASLKGSSEYSAPRELEKESWKEIQKNNDCSNQYIESAFDSHDQSMTGTPQSIDRNMSRSRSPDIISMKDLEDFAMEAIS